MRERYLGVTSARCLSRNPLSVLTHRRMDLKSTAEEEASYFLWHDRHAVLTFVILDIEGDRCAVGRRAHRPVGDFLTHKKQPSCSDDLLPSRADVFFLIRCQCALTSGRGTRFVAIDGKMNLEIEMARLHALIPNRWRRFAWAQDHRNRKLTLRVPVDSLDRG